jgi:hypothetical protein
MHHTDGPNYENKVAILSLESPCIFSFRMNLSTDAIGCANIEDVVTIILEPRSIIFFESDVYTHYLHGIEAVSVDVVNKETCINLQSTGFETSEVRVFRCLSAVSTLFKQSIIAGINAN